MEGAFLPPPKSSMLQNRPPGKNRPPGPDGNTPTLLSFPGSRHPQQVLVTIYATGSGLGSGASEHHKQASVALPSWV